MKSSPYVTSVGAFSFLTVYVASFLPDLSWIALAFMRFTRRDRWPKTVSKQENSIQVGVALRQRCPHADQLALKIGRHRVTPNGIETQLLVAHIVNADSFAADEFDRLIEYSAIHARDVLRMFRFDPKAMYSVT